MLKVQEIRELIKVVDQSTIDEFTYETEGTTVTMKKSGDHQGVKTIDKNAPSIEQPVAIPKVETHQVQVEKSPADVQHGKAATNDTANFDYEVVSPMVGTLYNAPDPESGPYVSKGSQVEKNTVVCIVEAMKLFNEIEAEVTGEIVEVLVEDGELVEYGQPLFRVKTK